jgi:Fe2+ transport system protein B
MVVLALSATSPADVVAARSFSTSASARASLDASESHSITGTTATVLAVVALSFVDCLAASRVVCVDASLATAAAAATMSHDELHLQLGPLCMELSCRERSPPT